jgi:F-type H+-transporting ATPase subunit b
MLRRLIFLLACVAVLWMRPLPVTAAPESETHGSSAVAAEHAAADAEHGEKKPDLLPDPTEKETWMQALWVVIIFLVLLAILYPTAWKSVLAGLKNREERIRTDIANAEAARTKAEATLRDYNNQLAAAESRVREMLSKATTDGEQIAAQIRTRAQQEAEEIKERNAKEIEAAKNSAIREIHETAADLATNVAAKILRRELNPADQQELVRQSLEQLPTISKN